MTWRVCLGLVDGPGERVGGQGGVAAQDELEITEPLVTHAFTHPSDIIIAKKENRTILFLV
jgi:hypothetical protein